LKGIGDVVGPGILRVVEINHPEQLLCLGKTLTGQGCLKV